MKKNRRRVAKARRALLTLSLVLVVAFAAVGGTVAWLTDKTESVVNTFTVGDVEINIGEDGATSDGTNLVQSFPMVPGNTISKKPYVTVEAPSEACYLFVKVSESSVLDTYIAYTVDEDIWFAGTKTAESEGNGIPVGIYYKVLTADTTTTTSYDILTGDSVKVNESVTKTDMEALEQDGAIQPTLSFKACAVQYENRTLLEAWELASPMLAD